MSAHHGRRRLTHAAEIVVQALERRTLLALALDPTFGRGGVGDNLVDGDANDFGLQPGFIHQFDDGRLLVGGLSINGGEPGVRVARYTKGGLLDQTFNGDGLSERIDTPNGGGQNAGGALQGDGKVLVAGTMFGTLGVVRFNADGSVDTGFGGGDGIATAGDFGDDDDRDISTVAMAVAADGKITLVGHESFGPRLLLARFNPNGTPDTTFSGDGLHTIDMDDIVAGSGDTGEVRAADMVALPDGKVVVLANIRINQQFASQPALIQLNADGSYDTSFSGDGRLPFKFGNAGSGNEAGVMLLQGSDIVVSGLDGTSDESGYVNRAALARFNPDGSLDTAFGDNGIGFAGADEFSISEGSSPFGLTIDPDGRFVGNAQFHLFRWTAGGDADTTFGPGGIADFHVSFGVERPIVVDDQGRFIKAANTSLVRLTEDPRPDLVLGDNGAIVITGEDGTADNTITIQGGAPSNLVTVVRNGASSTFDFLQVRAVDILVFDGDDDVTVTIDVPALVALGGGDNTLVLGDGDAEITAGDGTDDIRVGDGDHLITTAGGNDTIDADFSDGNVTLDAGDGNDSIATGGGHDTIQAGDGDDTVSAGGGADTVAGGAGSDSITGGAGADFLVAGATLAGVEFGASQNVIHGGDGNDILVGAWNRDSLYGGANNDYILGSAGSDLLNGGGGRDRIEGGGGNDRIYGGNGSDRIDAGVHDDRVAGGAGIDWIVGGRGVDILHGNDGDDRFFTVDSFVDTLDGGAGDDTAESDDDDVLADVTQLN